MSLGHLVRAGVRPLTPYAAPPAHAGIKLDANENPWPPSDAARERIATVIRDLDFHRYPDPEARALKALLPSVHGGVPGEYIIGSGSDEVIALLATALAEPRDGRARAAVLYPTPTFVMYEITSRAHGLDPVGVPLTDAWQLDVDAMCAALVRERPNIVFLATPNNPTGACFDGSAVRAIAEHDPGALVIVDEAYGAYAGRSLAVLMDELPNVGMLGTLSKLGLAAIRLGWARLPGTLAGEVEKARQPYNVSTLTQVIAVEALGTLRPELEEHATRVVEARTTLGAALAARGFRVYPSDANFFLVAPPEGLDVCARLKSRNIAVKAYAAGRLAGLLRITVGTPAENAALLAALA